MAKINDPPPTPAYAAPEEISKFEENLVEYVDVQDEKAPVEATPTCSYAGPQMRSKEDDLSVWEGAKKYKVVTLVAMAAAFSASLDGYRQSAFGKPTLSSKSFH